MNVATSEPSRNQVAQAAPDTGLPIADFPDGGQPSASMFRAHPANLGPWFFSSNRRGRFNLKGPNGTCYFADEIETAVRECLGPIVLMGNRISAARVSTLRVSVINPPDGAKYVHASGEGAARYGVTAELTSMADYSVPQAWAEALKDGGFDGIRYDSRFNPGAESWALFGLAGPKSDFHVDPSGTIEGPDAVRAAGIRIMPAPPTKSSVRVIGDPPA